jgi:hypothetical protein
MIMLRLIVLCLIWIFNRRAVERRWRRDLWQRNYRHGFWTGVIRVEPDPRCVLKNEERAL